MTAKASAESDEEFEEFVHNLQEIALAARCTMFLTTSGSNLTLDPFRIRGNSRRGVLADANRQFPFFTFADRARLRLSRQSPQRVAEHVWRAQIVLLTAEGVGTSAIMRDTGKSRNCVRRWQERSPTRLEGLLRDNTCSSRISELDPSIAERVVTLTMQAPPGETTHRIGVAMAEAARVSVSSVQRIWRANGLQPHRVRSQALQGTRIRRQAARRGRSLCRSAGACRRLSSTKRARSKPSTAPSRPADQKRRRRNHDPLLQAARDDDLFAAMNVLDGT